MKKKSLLIITVCILLTLAPTVTIYGDIGPKPTLTIIVKNPPQEEYYLDLLVYDYNNNFEIPKTDSELEKLLCSYADEGWYPAKLDDMYRRSGPPLIGSLVGEQVGSDMYHSFVYRTPKKFKIIIVTTSGEITVTDIIETQNYNSRINFDYKTMKAYEKMNFSMISQLPITLIATLLFEGLVLLLFMFKLRGNIKVFLITNVATQIFLYIGIIATTRFCDRFVVILLCEMIIIGVESAVFMRFLKGGTKLRRLTYAITANLVSVLGGGFLMSFMFFMMPFTFR